MLESLKIHIVVDQTETLEPQAYCFLTNVERGINHRTNLEQVSDSSHCKTLSEQSESKSKTHFSNYKQIGN